ncbi:DUF4267 domain-containing protein [Georgenia sp. MJ173]|uniref:DUF4267 domain-containing protein n=1 Tax=Georgenia sunbinii TaxID=3117728 RepID=UPI002F268887
MTTLLLVLAGLGALAIVVIGLRFLLVPRTAAAQFGLGDGAAVTAEPWLAVKGVRDVVSGLVVLPALLSGQAWLVGAMCLIAAVTPWADVVVATRSGGSRGRALAVHGGTGAALVVIGALLLLAADG